ncbi:hypothetical protein DENSPDRAFT_932556 [Dentipellis sp. KUC8613]|nr:hypothetical protein DENSPDRAFT_932556 [Dentipellis sp. KUC8613]
MSPDSSVCSRTKLSIDGADTAENETPSFSSGRPGELLLAIGKRKREEDASQLSIKRLELHPEQRMSFIYAVERFTIDRRLVGGHTTPTVWPPKRPIKTHGRTIADFNDIPELVDALYDAIKDLRAKKKPLSKEDLRLLDWKPSRPPPLWDDRQIINQERTGTRAFMSAEVVMQAYLFGRGWTTPSIFVHSAIHDLESFFWVLLHICLTRAGPGGTRRSGARPYTQDTNKTLCDQIFALFDNSDDGSLLVAKWQFIVSSEDLEQVIQPLIHPYFSCLNHLLSEWRKILSLGYNTYHNGYTPGVIHDLVLQVIDQEKKTLKSKLEFHSVVRKELKMRLEVESQLAKRLEATEKEMRRHAGDSEQINAAWDA